MADEQKKPDCMYGKDCYQKNPKHHEKYAHPSRNPESPRKREHSSEPENTNGSDVDTKKPKDGLLQNPYLELEEAAARALKVQLAELVKDRRKFIRQMFFAVFPQEFYDFWDFCKSIKPQSPETAFESFGLQLVGPFDVLAGKFDDSPLYEPLEYLTHWRFYYDVPEFQTVMVKAKTEIHYGYWRDIPLDDTEQCLIARNDSAKGCEMKMVAANMFQAVLHYLNTDFVGSPFTAQQVKKMKKSIEDWTKENNVNLTNAEELIKAREDKIVCRTFHRNGLVAPLDRRTKLGYRPLQVSDATLKKILEKFENVSREDKEAYAQAMEGLHPIVTAADIAVDEKDSATALELGIDIFCSGQVALHELCKLQLITGYTALGRPQYIAIAKTHLQSRRKGSNLDLLAQ